MASNVSIVIATKGAKDAANDIHEIGVKAEESSGHLGKLGSALGSIGTIAGGIIAAKGIETLGGAIRGAFSDAQEYQKMQAATNAVIESTGGKAGMSAKAVVDLANSLESVTAVDDQVIQGAENLLLTFTSIGKDVFPQATETVLNMSTALGQDAKSSAIQLGKALNDPINGVTALRRVGVSFTEAQLAQIAAMQKSGDLMGAQKIILSELNTEFGGAAKAAGSTFAGQLSLLQDTISDTFRDLAVKALPTLLQLTTIMAELLPKAIDLAGQGIGAFVDAVSPLAEMAFDGLKDLASAGIDLATVAWDKISGPLVDLTGLAWDGITAAGGALKDMALAAVDLAGVAWDKISGPLGDLASMGWDNLKSGIDSLRALAESKFDQVAPQFQSLSSAIKGIDMQTFASGWERVKSAIQPAVDVLKPLVEQLLASLKNQFQEVGKALGPLGSALADLASAFKPLEPLIKPIAEVLGVVIVGAIALLLVQLKLFTEFMTITLVGAINVATLAIEGIAAVFENVLGLLAPYVAKFISIGSDIIGGLLDGVISGGKALWEWLKDVGPAILRFVGDLGTILFDAGKAVIQGLWDGIESMLGWFGDKLGGIGDFIKAHKGPIEVDGQLLVPTGRAIIQGLAKGMEDGLPLVRDVAVFVAAETVNAVSSAVSDGLMALKGAMTGGASPAGDFTPFANSVSRGTDDQITAITKAMGSGGVLDWAANFATGFRGAAVGRINGPFTYAGGGSGIASMPDAGSVPSFVTDVAGRTRTLDMSGSQPRGALPYTQTINLVVDGQVLASVVTAQLARSM